MLYEFYGEECPHCQKMRVLTNKLMQEYPEVKVVRKEVWHNKENMELIKELDKNDDCGGVPFFYNDVTKAWLCGEVEYDDIKKWAGVK
jgi:thiol-disulfide isomerase/thioredoxin